MPKQVSRFHLIEPQKVTIAIMLMVTYLIPTHVVADSETTEASPVSAVGTSNHKLICVGKTVGGIGESRGTFDVAVTASELKWGNFGTDSRTAGIPIGGMAAYCLRHPNMMLRFPLQPGEKWSNSWSGYTAITEVVTASEPIVVPAGTFPDCLEIETRIRQTGEVEDEKAIVNSYCGRRRLWLAKGVGLVKMEYAHNDGSITEMRLLRYDIPSQQNYFPLNLGNEWTYYWHNDHHAYGIEETWILSGIPEKPLALSYDVSILEEYGLIHVRGKVKAPAPATLGLQMAQGWAAGENFPANVKALVAKDNNGNHLPISGENGTWLVGKIPPDGFEFSYAILPKQSRVRIEEEPTLSSDFAFIFGYGLFIVPIAEDFVGITVKFSVPTISHISLRRRRGKNSETTQ